MTAAAGFAPQPDLFQFPIAELNNEIRRVVSEIASFFKKAKPKMRSAEAASFDAKLAEKNSELKESVSAVENCISYLLETINAVNQSIDTVKIGDEKIDPNGICGEMLELTISVIEDRHSAVYDVERKISARNEYRSQVLVTIDLLRKIRDLLFRAFDLAQDLAYRIRIRDAMTERGSKTCGIPEFDALNDL